MAKARKARKVMSIGDVNPIDYGGGYVFTAPGSGGPWIEYFDGLEAYVDEIGEADADEIPNFGIVVYRVDLHEDAKRFLEWYDWVDWDDVAQTTGQQDIEIYTNPSNLRTVLARALAIQAAAGYYGWHEFDHDPLRLTVAELAKRWGI